MKTYERCTLISADPYGEGMALGRVLAGLYSTVGDRYAIERANKVASQQRTVQRAMANDGETVRMQQSETDNRSAAEIVADLHGRLAKT